MPKPRQLALLALLTAAAPALAQTVTHAFTFQGRLTDSSAPANGAFDLRFRLFDAASAGGQIGATLCANDVSVADGVFTVLLDFGDQFSSGSQRFLESEVRAEARADGIRRARVSVLFGNFVRTSEDRVRDLQERLAALERTLGR